MGDILRNILGIASRFIESMLNETETNDEENPTEQVEESDYFVSLYDLSPLFDWILTFVGVLVVTFMTKRKARCRDCCGSHIALAVPLNFLEERKRRKPFVAAFALAAMAIIQTIFSMDDLSKGESASVKIIIKLFLVSYLGCQYLPLFACIYMETLPACVFGLIYHIALLVLEIIATIPEPNISTKGIVDEILLDVIVMAIAGTFLIYWFIKRIIRCSKNEVKRHIVPKNQANYVSHLVLPKDRYLMLQETGSFDEPKENKISQFVRKHIYHNIPGFRYSLTILVSCTIGFLIITHISIIVYNELAQDVMDTLERLDRYKYLKSKSMPNFVSMIVKRFTQKRTRDETPVTDPDAISIYDFLYAQNMIVLVASILGGIVAYVIGLVSICKLMTTYRKNVIGLSKNKHNQMIIAINGDVSNISLVRSAIQYGGYQVAYLFAGFSIQLFALTLIFFILGEIIVLPIQFAFWSFVLKVLEILAPIIFALIFIQLTQYLLIRFCFLEDRGKTMALTNRRGFFIMSYFVFFYNIFGGIFSCIKRILIGAGVGALVVSRLDISVFPRIFEKYDSGFKAYSCLLYLEALQSNPIVVTFVTYLSQSRSKYKHLSSNFIRKNLILLERKLKKRKRVAKNRWFVAYTLLRNPTIIDCRGHLTLLAIMEAYSKPIPDPIKAKHRNSVAPY